MQSKIQQQMIAKINGYRPLLYIILGVILLYGVIWFTTQRSQMPKELKASIDSLTLANKKLMESQIQMDSSIAIYEREVTKVDNQISHIKSQTTIVNKYYTDLGHEVDQYIPNQIDSFFKQRYNY